MSISVKDCGSVVNNFSETLIEDCKKVTGKDADVGTEKTQNGERKGMREDLNRTQE